MKLNSYQKQVMHGLMLGDGHIANNKSNAEVKNYLYTQTFGQHSELLAKYVFETFNDFCTPKGLYTYKVQSGKDSPFYQRFIVRTMTLPIFQEFADMYYVVNELGKRIKIIPLDIEMLLTPILLANFIMSDGNFNKQKQIIRLYTNNFTKQEVALLSTAIYNKFGISSRVEHDRNNQYILVIRKTTVPKFQELIKSYIIPSMLYRIGL